MKRQHGQSAVLVILFSAILIASAFAMFKAGKLTTNKMQLQNAADAAAYSMSVVEARDLNFSSYMNRAMVANEVAVGQFVGLASWAFHFKSFADYLDTYNALILAPATLGASTTAVTNITSSWRSYGGIPAVRVMTKLANVATLVFHNINKIYGYSAVGYHTVSVISAVGVLDDVITQNGPPGTKLSDFGIISLIAHVATYGVLPNLPGDQFATGYLPNSKLDVDEFGNEDSGYARLAALIRDSRDPFTMARGWELRPPGFPINVDTGLSFGFGSIPPFEISAGFELKFTFDLSLERKGASELRFVLPDSGQIAAGQYANWSSADTTGLFLFIDFYFRAWAEVCAGVSKKLSACFGSNVGGSFKFGDSKASLILNIYGVEFPIIPEIPFPTAAPFGSGFAEVGKNTPNNLGLDDMALDSVGGPISTDRYGEAANNMLAWLSVGPPAPATSPTPAIPPIGVGIAGSPPYETALGSRVNKSYAGLPPYVDTTGKGPFLDIGAPNLLIGLVQDESDFDTYRNNDGSVEDSQEPAGRLRLNEALADEELAVIAKSEVYFSRPVDKFATHFHRGDGLAETGSAFNPYWQARLLDTTYADRTLALAIQQKQDFVNLNNSFDSLLNKLSSMLPSF